MWLWIVSLLRLNMAIGVNVPRTTVSIPKYFGLSTLTRQDLNAVNPQPSSQVETKKHLVSSRVYRSLVNNMLKSI